MSDKKEKEEKNITETIPTPKVSEPAADLAVENEPIAEEPVAETTATVEETPEVVEETPEVVEETLEVVDETPEAVDETPEVVEETPEAVEETPEVVDETSEAVEETPEVVEEAPEVVDETPEVVEETKSVIEDTPTPAPATAVAKKESKTTDEHTHEDEDEVVSSDEEEAEEHAEEVDYHALSKQELIAALSGLIKSKPVQEVKNEVEEIKSEFNAKFAEELAHKKEEFLATGGNIIDFHYSTPLKKEFNSLYFDYKEKRNAHYRSLKKDLQSNLEKRLELIEELKGLLNAEENINTTYKHFKDIQSKWFEAGAIPRDKYNTVWNTYHHHVENFYDFLHLNREFRDLDFKHNLEQKLKLITRAEELAGEENINRAFRELQMLHKMWKEEIGPVAKEFREDVWNKFSAATKVVHDKRQGFLEAEEKSYETNYEAKKVLIAQIKELSETTKPAHQAWQAAIKKVQVVRDTYFETGKVPRAQNKETWNAFKEATRAFNKAKNDFYKNQKKDQFTNLEKKLALIEIAEANKESDDFEATTAVMKKIQQDWKGIGHVPRKDSDKIWKQFKTACNHYFDRVHAEKNEANKEEVAHYETKTALLDSITTMEMSADHAEDIKTIKEKISAWKQVGRVPYNKRYIEQKFNKALDTAFGKLDLGKKETELIKFENKIHSMASQEDERKLQNEQYFISKKIEETKGEIRQLENNLGFFQHVPDDNPMVKEVHANIQRHKEQLEVWKVKLKKIKELR